MDPSRKPETPQTTPVVPPTITAQVTPPIETSVAAPVQSVTTPVTPASPPPQPVNVGGVQTKSNKMLYVLIALLLLILLSLVGLFFYKQFSAVTSKKTEIAVPTPEAANTPTVVIPTYSSEAEKEVMGVDVGDVDSQLNIIEKDVNKL